MRSKEHQSLTLSDLEHRVIPALMTSQYAIAEGQSTTTGAVSPVGVLLWAQVSAEVDRRLSQDAGVPIRLDPAEWTSGEIPWLVDAIGEPRVLASMIRRLSETTFRQAGLKSRARNPEGTYVIRTFKTEG